jgi:thiamine transport system substrate-binding protein
MKKKILLATGVLLCCLVVVVFVLNNLSANNLKKVVVVTHSAFAMSEEMKKSFKEKTGYDLEIVDAGDDLANKISLSADSPLGDVVYGVDNTFLSRVESSDALGSKAIEVDYSDVCVNADIEWFKNHNIEMPSSFEDLAKPEYKGLLVVQNPASSTPGLSFLLATIKQFGEEKWLDYWKSLKANDLKIDSSWTQAYNIDFSAGGQNGKYPLVVSYSSSPFFTIDDSKKNTRTMALLKTSFRQKEFVAVLKGSKNSDGAKAAIDFFLSDEFQAQIPAQMYMYPVSKTAKISGEWNKFAKISSQPIIMKPEEIYKGREKWIEKWRENITH